MWIFFCRKKNENGKIEDIVYKNKTKDKDLIGYFYPGENGENKSIWLELKITAKELVIFDSPYIKFVIKKK